MRNDELPNDDQMDELLTHAMRAEIPQLSPDFDAALMQRVRPRRLSPVGRVVMGSYAVIAVAITGWLMRDVPMPAVLAGLIVGVAVAAATMAYTRRLVPLR